MHQACKDNPFLQTKACIRVSLQSETACIFAESQSMNLCGVNEDASMQGERECISAERKSMHFAKLGLSFFHS